eukprot:TRINITY_DN8744_c0_g1_i4.p2 TRINITY_DN8744_c0_g1~~TRINITY_DN8744_c0_g1_i4.p2  ORF type:complete len:411 (-),score=64.48 TRINITY_DN8744_c0_g1_i4:203-1324(-)
MVKEATKFAVEVWGDRQLEPLEAEDKLSIACERAPTDDEVIKKLRECFRQIEAEYEAVTTAEKKEVVSLGGLHVVGTERHESRRIDNQLRGRGGRQGDPGSTRFFLSLEDNLFRIFGGDRMKGLMDMFRVGDLPIESQMLTNALDEAQRKVENYFFDIRKQLFDYDQVLNTQRERVYSDRRRALLSFDLAPLMKEYAEKTVDDVLEANVNPSSIPFQEWPLDDLAYKMVQYCWLLEGMTGDELRKASGDGDFEKLRGYLREKAYDAYLRKVSLVDDVEKGLMQEAQRFFVLMQTDNLWKEHLNAITFLRQAIGLRGYGQRDPLTEYKLEAYKLFVDMMARIRRNVIYNVYLFEPRKMNPDIVKQKEETKAIMS